MAHRAIFVSDLHLTTNPHLDDFTRDEDFEALLDLPELRPDVNGVDLVLLGDTFDLWQSVEDEECRKSKAKDIRLDYRSAPDTFAELYERHRCWFDALAKYARRDGARVVFVPGNHDRSLVDAGFQDALADRLGGAPVRPHLSFPSWYESADLALYADHGSQYDENNDVASFDGMKWQDDSAGYYFVKLFFNRLEHRDPRIENSPSGWPGVWHWLRRAANFGLLAAAIRWYWQYWNDERVPRRIGLARAVGGPGGAVSGEPKRIESTAAPLLLVASAGTKATAFFSQDPEMEEFFREAYARSPEVRVAVNEIIDARRAPERGATRATTAAPRSRAARGRSAAARRAALARPRSQVPSPTGSRPVPAVRTRGPGGRPSDVEWAERLFRGKPFFRAQLTYPEFRFVVFGHTHGELAAELSNKAVYLNTGSWTSPKGPLPVVVAEMSPSGAAARLARFSNGLLS